MGVSGPTTRSPNPRVSSGWLAPVVLAVLIVLAVLGALAPPSAAQLPAPLESDLGRIFEGETYDEKRFGPARWLHDGESYTTVEPNAADAKELVANGCFCVSEGANMPTEPEGVDVFLNAKVLYGWSEMAYSFRSR